MYQRVGKAAYKADLSNTITLLDHLDNPHHSFKTIHVAGTNGKGSTSHMLASVLQEAGFKVGLYTSPHLKDFRERIKVNGRMIAKSTVAAFINKNKVFFEENELSFFEMTVGLAFNFFKKEAVDIAIIEVGLGGRLDSTNVITPEVSVITNIGMDHMQFLGDTIFKIATEKAGVIKPNIPVVIGETVPDSKLVFVKMAEKNKAPISFAEAYDASNYETDLLGDYQKFNKKTVLMTLNVLKKLGWNVTEKAIVEGLKNTVRNTGLLGRWQVLRDSPKVICDTAHNPDGLKLALNQLRNEEYLQLHIVLGTVDDKDLSKVLSLFPANAIYYFCKPDVPRGLNAKILENKAMPFGLLGEVYLSVKMAYNNALHNASENDVIFIGGSTFTVAEVL
ncbi:MAG: dihydrofolate synthase/folylpolyglutamate synthase [Sediminicola sp.]|jgi:dihydrofolate synthase/folylpolyglutamate synthase|tara:strand:+ start:1052 stop:2224 length:1173 start_codon:yes stop_codon:yes gene_type:complete